MSELLKINVNDHTERKNGLTYLSWAWAWAEVLKIDPKARYEVRTFGEGKLPVCYIGESAMVCVEVVIKDMARECWLPVMDNRNKAIKHPDAFAVNTAIMRCMTKAIGLHGLGLYIYAGEDLPEGDESEPQPERNENGTLKGAGVIKATDGAMESLEAEQQSYLRSFAVRVTKACQDGAVSLAVDKIAEEGFDNIQLVALWSCLDSKVRSAIKAEQKRRSEAANQPHQEAA